jgi:putative SOS response-associated peptidase YedK
MCGRFTKMHSWAEVHSFLSLDLLRGEVADALFRPSYNFAPTQVTPVARACAPATAELAAMRWGLVPSWSKDVKKHAINARAETVATQAMFRSAFRRRRCLVPANGYYEWQALPGERAKQPWYFQPAEGSLFAFGGVWERWGEGADAFESFAIITTAANEFVAPVHDRMPLIVAREHHAQWLFGTPEEASALLVPVPGTLLAAHRVSTRVNRPAVNDASLIAAVDGG